MTKPHGSIFGLLAEFDTPAAVVRAAEQARHKGYRRMDAYTPFPVEGLEHALALPKDRVSLVCLIGGLMGLIGAFALQTWINTVGYPLNIGGKPLFSWPSFIVVSFEMTILFAGLSAVIGMLGMNGLPMPYHPLFNAPSFVRASSDRFFLCIESRDPLFDSSETREFLQSLGSKSVVEVPH